MFIQVDPQAAEHFLALLGKNGDTRIRGFYPTGHPLKAQDKGRKAGFSIETATAWQNEGRGVYPVINNGGDIDADIKECVALFCEWDDRPVEWQVNAWRELGLPEPTCIVVTGGKSAHCYWVFESPIPVAIWKDLQARLLEYADADRTLKNPSRVMRLPGAYHLGPNGEVNGQTTIVHESGARYTPELFDELLPSIELVQQQAIARGFREHESLAQPRSFQQIQDALKHIPAAVPNKKQYPFYRNLLWGMIRACEEAGAGADDAARLMKAHSPLFAEVDQVARSSFSHVNASTFWYWAQHHGYQLSQPRQQPQEQHQGFKPEHAPQKKKERKARPLSHARRMECFNRCVEVQAQRQRNSLRRRARLLKAAKDLEISGFINRQEIAQLVLEAKDRQQGHCFAVLTAQDRAAMKQPIVRWAIPALVPEGDLTIIGGRPKVGKTRLAVAMAASALNGTDCIGFGEPDPRTVLLVTDDQADADTCAMLQALKVWDHPNLLWSRHFRFQENDLDALLEALKVNPGALVIIDSLRSISRSLQYGENDPEIGAALYDLKQAVIDSGSTLVLIHHCNKSADLVGTEALSGHNAIAGAANTVITLHYCPDANGKADKSNPQRRMVREARTGEGCDIVIDRGAGAGTFRQVAEFSHWQQQLDLAKKSQKELDQLDNLTKDQREVLDVVTDNDGLTVKQITFNWKDTDPTSYQVKHCRRVLDSLKRKELVSERPAKGGATFHRRETPPTPEPEILGFLGSSQSGTAISWGHQIGSLGVSPCGATGLAGSAPNPDQDQKHPLPTDSEPSEQTQTQSDPLQRKERPQKPICPDPMTSLAAQGETPKTPSRGVSREDEKTPPSPTPLWDDSYLDDLDF